VCQTRVDRPQTSEWPTAFRRLALAAICSTPDSENDEVDPDRDIGVAVDPDILMISAERWESSREKQGRQICVLRR
jgi:hypothetical protein